MSIERLDQLGRLVGEAATAHLRVGRLLDERLGVEAGSVPEQLTDPLLHLVRNAIDHGIEPPTIHRPSADELFTSLAIYAQHAAVGVLLTGMGEDGAVGLLAMRERGGITIAQDAASSVVDGMPAAARRIGAAAEVHPLAGISGAIKEAVARITA